MAQTPTVADLMELAAKADDEYATAVVDAAQARADYELAYYRALANCPIKTVAGRKEAAEAEANEQHRVWLIAEAREKSCRTHVQVTLGLLVAAQSQQKHAGRQDGGDW